MHDIALVCVLGLCLGLVLWDGLWGDRADRHQTDRHQTDRHRLDG
ncbi:MAG TPA: hypothetical protein V6D46_09925 [Coleofasciculaceae cyanobacterium]